jgi:hypothetical protein
MPALDSPGSIRILLQGALIQAALDPAGGTRS